MPRTLARLTVLAMTLGVVAGGVVAVRVVASAEEPSTPAIAERREYSCEAQGTRGVHRGTIQVESRQVDGDGTADATVAYRIVQPNRKLSNPYSWFKGGDKADVQFTDDGALNGKVELGTSKGWQDGGFHLLNDSYRRRAEGGMVSFSFVFDLKWDPDKGPIPLAGINSCKVELPDLRVSSDAHADLTGSRDYHCLLPVPRSEGQFMRHTIRVTFGDPESEASQSASPDGRVAVAKVEYAMGGKDLSSSEVTVEYKDEGAPSGTVPLSSRLSGKQSRSLQGFQPFTGGRTYLRSSGPVSFRFHHRFFRFGTSNRKAPDATCAVTLPDLP